jgi:hypothetical protein
MALLMFRPLGHFPQTATRVPPASDHGAVHCGHEVFEQKSWKIAMVSSVSERINEALPCRIDVTCSDFAVADERIMLGRSCLHYFSQPLD